MMRPRLSQNLQALVPIENYHIVLNERSRNRQNTTQIKQQEVKSLKSSIIRRKSCNCSCCGPMNNFQQNMMNIPLQRAQIEQKTITLPQSQIEPPSKPQKSRRILFQSLKSIKSPEKDSKQLSLEAHGFGNKLKKQNTLKMMMSETNERLQKKQKQIRNDNYSVNNSLQPENVVHSSRSLQIDLGIRVNKIFTPNLSPRSEIEIPQSLNTQRNTNKQNVYFQSSQKYIKHNKSAFQPIRMRSPQLVLPRIKSKFEE